MHTVELLAPAGSFDAACAAFQYGADAVYLGLRSHSARAEAVNFTPGELSSAVAYAHSLSPRRAVYAAVNTLLRDEELPGLLDTLAAAAEACVDGIIVQDFAVHALARRHFPSLALHASTQMCVHNLEGAVAMRELGFSRVVLARELTLGEIRDIAAKAAVETEVFIHGALCYGYSGLCLFSAFSAGRSGNRGRCAYCCREPFSTADGRRTAFPFSMRDLCLGERARDLAAAGVTSLKIEGRMKSPLYVAAAAHLYRLILDGHASPEEIQEAASDLQTVFSRPGTRLYLDGRKGDPRGVVDAATVGHRGAPVGCVEGVRPDRGRRMLRFTTSRAIEVHDGIQVDLPGRPYGFPVDLLRRAGESRAALSCPAGACVEVGLPAGAPLLPLRAPVFCSASQAVRRKFAFTRPRRTEAHASTALPVAVTLSPGGAAASADLFGESVSVVEPAPLAPADRPASTPGAVEKAFGRMGESRWRAASVDLRDPWALYAPPPVLNGLRRRLCAALDAADDRARASGRAARAEALQKALSAGVPSDPRVPVGLSVKVRAARVPEPFDAAEVVLAPALEAFREPAALSAAVARWRDAAPRVRVALPAIIRGDGAAAVESSVLRLRADGVRDWECADCAGLHLLRRLCGGDAVTADATFYAFNGIAAAALRALGVAAVVAPAEADDAQLQALCRDAPGMVIAPVRMRPPLFLSETRPAVPWERGAAYAIYDRRGNPFTVERYGGLWHTRQAAATLREPPPGAIRLRRDLTDEA